VIDKVCIVSVSGGKDSTLCLALAIEKYKDTGIPVIPVFADTGWEHPATYEYLKTLEEFFQVRIVRLKATTMLELIRKKRIFPSLRRRFCTQHLKSFPQKEFYKWLYFQLPFRVAEIWIGMRREESPSRRGIKDHLLPAGEKTRFGERFPFDLHFIYPVKDLTTGQVFKELKKRKIPVNPLYSQGFSRVGCYPCFISKKDIIKVIIKALEGDSFSMKRLKELQELDRELESRINIDFTFDELLEQAKEKYRLSKMLLPLPFDKKSNQEVCYGVSNSAVCSCETC